MENQITIFRNPEFGEIRTFVDENDTPWLIGKDVASALGYKDTVNAIKSHVDDDDKGVANCHTLGGIQKLVIINESGMYSLILSSKLPQAKQFKHWVTSEVLPSIRKHGAYLTDHSLEKALTDPDYLIKLANVLKDERHQRLEMATKVTLQGNIIEQQKSEIMELDKQVGSLKKSVDEMKEKVSYLDLILATNTSLNITQIAQDYGMSAIKLNKHLSDLHIQYKQNDQWILYAKFKDKGYVTSQTIHITPQHGAPFIKLNTVWTPDGRMFIYNQLKAIGILPTIEK